MSQFKYDKRGKGRYRIMGKEGRRYKDGGRVSNILFNPLFTGGDIFVHVSFKLSLK